MSSQYVICKADSSPILKFPTGIAVQTVRAGRRYSAAEAVVQQHPHLFREITPTPEKAS
jgi:hypothetical protein